MNRNDLTVILASARRILELAADLPKSKRHNFFVEAAAIITLIETQLKQHP